MSPDERDFTQYEQPEEAQEQRPSYLDKVIERYGLDREPEGRPEREAEAEPEERATPARPEPRQPAREARQTERQELTPPKRGALERRERRDAQIRLLSEQVERQNKQIETLLQAVTGSKTPPEIDPVEDPTGWYKQAIKEAVADGFGGEEIIAGLREIVEERRQQAQGLAQQAEVQRQVAAYSDRLTDYEEEFFEQNPTHRETYYQHLENFVGNIYLYWKDLGKTDQEAGQLAIRGLATVYMQAEEQGWNPAEYWYRKWLVTAPPALPGGNGNGAAPDPKARQSKENRETAARAKAGQNAGATLSTAKAPPAASPGAKVRTAAESSPGSARALIRAAQQAGAKAGKDPREILRESRRDAG